MSVGDAGEPPWIVDVVHDMFVDEEESAEETPEGEPKPRLDEGAIFLAGKNNEEERYRLGIQDDEEDLSYTPYEMELAGVIGEVLPEIQMLEWIHQTPDGRPWAEQPWWKVELWLAWKQGEAEGFRARSKG